MLPPKSITLPLVVAADDEDDNDNDDELTCVAVVCLPQARKNTEELSNRSKVDFHFIEHLVD